MVWMVWMVLVGLLLLFVILPPAMIWYGMHPDVPDLKTRVLALGVLPAIYVLGVLAGLYLLHLLRIL